MDWRTCSSTADTSAAEKTLRNIAGLTARLSASIDKLDETRSKADHGGDDHYKHACYYRDQIVPAMNEVRVAADALELVVDDNYWPIPKYREMLFMY